MKRLDPALLFATAALALLASCRKEVAKAPAPPPTAVIVDEVTQRDVPIYVENVARTEADSTVEILARVRGFLVEAPFKEGSRVKKGDLLFQIDPLPFKAAVNQSEAALAKAEATRDRKVSDVARLEPLASQKAISQQTLDDAIAASRVAEADVLAGEASLELAKLDLGYTEMRAPFDGMIGGREVDVGNYVGSTTENTLLATISTVDPIRAVCHIPEVSFLRFQRRFLGDQDAADRHGEALEFELILTDGTTYEHKGRFAFVDRTLDARAGTLKLVVSFPNPGLLLRPGQFGRIRVAPEERKGAILVPQKAVVTIQSARAVMLVTADNKVEQRPIVTTDRFEDRFIVSKGLEKGDRVIVEGLQKVRPGMPVNPLPPSAMEAPPAR
ncbi:efflux RND transporter periplasmic adaptor subunit [Luteolibacter sp. Populi]|uniref:efflux RND transporter periplasmic adaptor subunit n=1 Tax=Luteolibacter sp. Populi TaxID=3230487 RepID=UPI0034665264